MTETELEVTFVNELHRIAPDIAVDEIDKTGDLRDEFDIDSMDFLTLVTALSKTLNITIPEADYDQMSTFSDALDYLHQSVA